MSRTARLVLSIPLAFLLLVISTKLGNWFELGFFNTWSVIHGTFLILIPLYALLAYYLLGLAVRTPRRS